MFGLVVAHSSGTMVRCRHPDIKDLPLLTGASCWKNGCFLILAVFMLTGKKIQKKSRVLSTKSSWHCELPSAGQRPTMVKLEKLGIRFGVQTGEAETAWLVGLQNTQVADTGWLLWFGS